MDNSSQSRRDLGYIVAIVLGLAIGFFIKRVHVGLLIGLVIGLVAAGLGDGRRK
jgi:F0F1-type ATP synthase assembly protein I